MSNEKYLIVSYFAVGAACLGLGFLTFGLLRASFGALTRAAPGGRLGHVLRRLFLLGIVLPAMLGFLSVSFRSCSKQTYPAIVADRSYLVAKNQEQLKAGLSHIAVALLAWGVIVAMAMAATEKRNDVE